MEKGEGEGGMCESPGVCEGGMAVGKLHTSHRRSLLAFPLRLAHSPSSRPPPIRHQTCDPDHSEADAGAPNSTRCQRQRLKQRYGARRPSERGPL